MLPHLPSTQAEAHELADFAELIAWERGSVSARELVAFLGRLDDNDHNIGVNDDDDENAELAQESMMELDRRRLACGPNGYPFEIDPAGNSIRHNPADDDKLVIYRFLLLGTRLNMKRNRIHGELDGTFLLEELGAHVLRHYLGKHKAKSFVFGTSTGTTFQERVNSLCEALGEGKSYRSIDERPSQAQDDKLDTVGWVPFSDSLPGQLIAFGQCKTGSSWGNLVTQLQPHGFHKKWLEIPILVEPIRALLLAEAADRSRWKTTVIDAGILFDRCRIVDFSDDVESALMKKIKRWTIEAHKTVETEAARRRPSRGRRGTSKD